MTSAVLPAWRLRPLPRTVVPLHRESQGSYIDRLAVTNQILPDELRDHLSGPRYVHTRSQLLPHALSQVARQPLDRLLRAIPDLRTPELTAHLPRPCREQLHAGWTVQPVCTLCLIAKGVHHARHWIPPGTMICLRHQRWTGMHGQQFDISPLPEIPQAQRQHHHLIHRYGWQPVAQAIRDASSICWTWWDNHRFRKALDRRRAALHGPAWSAARQSLVVVACAYPDIVALVDLMTSPALRSLLLTDSFPTRHRFVEEVRARVASGYNLPDLMVDDPLALWIEKERHHRTLSAPRPPKSNS